ncbi:MAG TPA: hypothetical protein H9845_06925 [Candidatus Agathobaculum pullicola]|uniref:hypothetical protein n=1 Tax=Candidatus Agathobaculum pullicola TaxID=2838426 RepID=UPI001F957899|nr:hypothetical protein [Candidatus Agathobaculum pullicola]
MRARFNGMKYRPSRRGDLYAWGTYSIVSIDGCLTVQDETCIAVRRGLRGIRRSLWPEARAAPKTLCAV